MIRGRPRRRNPARPSFAQPSPESTCLRPPGRFSVGRLHRRTAGAATGHPNQASSYAKVTLMPYPRLGCPRAGILHPLLLLVQCRIALMLSLHCQCRQPHPPLQYTLQQHPPLQHPSRPKTLRRNHSPSQRSHEMLMAGLARRRRPTVGSCASNSRSPSDSPWGTE